MFEPNLARSFGGVLRRKPRWRLENATIPTWNGNRVGNAFDQAWERGAHHSTELWRVRVPRAQVVGTRSASNATPNDWRSGTECEIHMRCDRSAAGGTFAQQTRTGETRHVDVRFFLVQQAEQDVRLKVLTVPTSENLSDTSTQTPSQVECGSLLSMFKLPNEKRSNGATSKIGEL